MRLGRIWRILQIKKGVAHRGRRLGWITPSETCRILLIIRKPNSIIALLFIQHLFKNELFAFLLTKNSTTLSSDFSVNNSIICSWQQFWRYFDVIGTIICNGLHFWGHRFNMTKLFLNLVNSSWLWWIMRVALTNLVGWNGEIFWINNNCCGASGASEQQHNQNLRILFTNTRAKRLRMRKVSIFKMAVANGNFTTRTPFLS